MSVIQLHIVGIPYRKDIAGHVSEFLAEAPGHAMTIRPQNGNDHDKTAIRAYDWQGRFVGFVSQKDLPIAWGAFRDSGKKSLRGMRLSTLFRPQKKRRNLKVGKDILRFSSDVSPYLFVYE